MIGQPPDADAVRPQQWPFGPRDGREVREFAMMNFVRMLGGEYFFAPSLRMLKGLTARTSEGG